MMNGRPLFSCFYILVHVMVNVGTFYMDHYIDQGGIVCFFGDASAAFTVLYR